MTTAPGFVHTESTFTQGSSHRIASVDIVRGLVMIIMALDHVRDLWSNTPFRPEDLTQTSVFLFFTRFITHFCAPTFVFLSGVSIFLHTQRIANKKDMTIFLLTRGLWLVFLEITVCTFLLQFAYQIILIQVIWTIGWSMIILSGLIWLPRKYLAVIALIIICGHNLLPNLQPTDLATILPAILHNSPFLIQSENLPPILVAYTIFPWAAVMLAGYVIGEWFQRPLRNQRSVLVTAGLCLLVLFIIVRAINIYGDPSPWEVQPRGFVFTLVSFFNVTKYPPSLLFICLTVGTSLLLLALFSGVKNKFTDVLQVYGQVPFFYYLIHLALIVGSAYVWSYISFGTFTNFAFMPPAQWPAEYAPSLARTYLVWILVVAILYFPCRWYARYKSQNRSWWLSYL
jgi:uncharacterized membrane protein